MSANWRIKGAELLEFKADQQADMWRLDYSRVRVLRRTLSAMGASVDVFAVVVDVSSKKGV